jgi:hypothetical protein
VVANGIGNDIGHAGCTGAMLCAGVVIDAHGAKANANAYDESAVGGWGLGARAVWWAAMQRSEISLLAANIAVDASNAAVVALVQNRHCKVQSNKVATAV